MRARLGIRAIEEGEKSQMAKDSKKERDKKTNFVEVKSGMM